MKIQIVQQGYQTFTGLLGDVKFEDGVSIKDVSPQQAAYVAAMFTTQQITESAAEVEAPAAEPAEEPVPEVVEPAAEEQE